MEYKVGRGCLGSTTYLEITADEFRLIKAAKRGIFTLLGIEEKFDNIIQNYVEYERELLDMALDSMVTSDFAWTSLHDCMSRINRRLANCLTVCRLYLDQSGHDLASIYGKNSELAIRLRTARNVGYDNYLGYRVMEGLRNYLQHQGLPVALLACPTGWQDCEGGVRRRHHRVSPRLDLDRLREDGALKEAVLSDLDGCGRRNLEISPLLRQYIDGLTHVHKELRDATNAEIAPWTDCVMAMMNRFCDYSGENPKAVYAYRLDGEATVETISLFRDGIDRLEHFRQKRLPASISHAFVSSEGVSPKLSGISI